MAGEKRNRQLDASRPSSEEPLSSSPLLSPYSTSIPCPSLVNRFSKNRPGKRGTNPSSSRVDRGNLPWITFASKILRGNGEKRGSPCVLTTFALRKYRGRGELTPEWLETVSNDARGKHCCGHFPRKTSGRASDFVSISSVLHLPWLSLPAFRGDYISSFSLDESQPHSASLMTRSQSENPRKSSPGHSCTWRGSN